MGAIKLQMHSARLAFRKESKLLRRCKLASKCTWSFLSGSNDRDAAAATIFTHLRG
jgi:phosphate/sulfate permease